MQVNNINNSNNTFFGARLTISPLAKAYKELPFNQRQIQQIENLFMEKTPNINGDLVYLPNLERFDTKSFEKNKFSYIDGVHFDNIETGFPFFNDNTTSSVDDMANKFVKLLEIFNMRKIRLNDLKANAFNLIEANEKLSKDSNKLFYEVANHSPISSKNFLKEILNIEI